MRCNIIHIDPDTCNETIENVRYTDEIGEHEGLTDQEIDEMEIQLKQLGWFYLEPQRRVQTIR